MENQRLNKTVYIISIYLFLVLFLSPIQALPDENKSDSKKSVSFFPILMYDSDIGVGYGGKAKFVNYFSKNESLDAIVFNLSKMLLEKIMYLPAMVNGNVGKLHSFTKSCAL